VSLKQLPGHITRLLPLPTPRTAWLMGLGMVVAFLLGWKGALLANVAVLGFCALDYAMTTRGPAIQVSRRHPQRISQGIPHPVEISMTNSGPGSRSLQVPGVFNRDSSLHGCAPPEREVRFW
jgi:hypothetical protein